MYVALVSAIALIALIALSGCSHDGRTLRPPGPDQTLSIVTSSSAGNGATTFQLASPFGSTTKIQKPFTCNGADQSPGFSWVGLPPGTVQLALTMIDLDATNNGHPFVHWVLTGMDPASVTEIREGSPPESAVVGMNDFGNAAYGGPCPPNGKTHRYRITLYALTAKVDVAPATPGQQVIDQLDAQKAPTAVVESKYP